MRIRPSLHAIVAATALAMMASACASTDGAADGESLSLDWATYNPLSLIIRDQGWLEDEGLDVEWTQSAGSNRANELLRAEAIDVGSTAGSAALLARANGAEIKTISLYTQPEWSAIVVPPDSDITDVSDLEGANIAATRGTDPYFFLLQTLDEAGIDPGDVEIQNLQHADGRTALDNGDVEAWAGLDPIMAATQQEVGSELIYRNIDFNTWGFLNATESFLEESPELAQLVVDTYERARQWALDNPDETAQLLADESGIDLEVAETTLLERTNIDIDPVPGDVQREVLEVVGPIFVDVGDVDDQSDIDEALDSLFEPSFAEAADPDVGAEDDS